VDEDLAPIIVSVLDLICDGCTVKGPQRDRLILLLGALYHGAESAIQSAALIIAEIHGCDITELLED